MGIPPIQTLLFAQAVVQTYVDLGYDFTAYLTIYGLMIILQQPAFLMPAPSIVTASLPCAQLSSTVTEKYDQDGLAHCGEWSAA